MPSVQESTQAAYSVLRQQMARRTAEQAAARAAALENEAKRAREVAAAAEETAQSLESRAGSARNHADASVRALNAVEGSQRTEQTLAAQFLRLSQTLRQEDATDTDPPAVAPSSPTVAFDNGAEAGVGQLVDTAV